MSDDRTPFGDSTPGLPDATLRALDVGQLIAGRFRLVRPLGKGGMGVVWLARDESLGEEVAFKFLAEIVAHDEASLHDLKRELRRTRQLTHHHIIRVHDLVEDPARGVAGITMEVAAGGSLAARRAKTEHGWFEPPEIAEWMRQLCEALDYAHRHARVVHRDLKPANLLLDAEGRLKIADFGIAAALHESATRLTAGKVSGTPLYMSPEQWQGFPPAPSDDLYALGSTLYDLLTGKPPFYSGNVAAAAMSLTPVSMAQRRFELENLDAPVPAEWEEAVAALLAKTADERPASAGEVAIRLGLLPPTHVPPRGPIRVRTAPGHSDGSPEIPPAPAASGDSAELETAFAAVPPAASEGARSTRQAPEKSAPATSPATAPPSRRKSPAVWSVLTIVLLLGGVALWQAGQEPSARHTTTMPAAATPATESVPFDQLVQDTPQLPIGSKLYRTSRGLLVMRGPFGHIGPTGKVIVDPQWDKAGPFLHTGTGVWLSLVERGGKFAFIDRTGRYVVRPQWDEALPFSEGLARVTLDYKSGFIDPTDKLVIPLQWESAAPFSHGLALVRRAGKSGFIDKTGALAIPLEWDGAWDFTGGLAPVKRGGKWGFIDTMNRLIIPPKWDSASSFAENFALVQLDGKFGFLDTNGAPVIEPKWEFAKSFSEGRAAVQEGDKWGFIDTTGALVVPLKWDEATSYGGNHAAVAQADRWGLIDQAGHVAVPLEWDGVYSLRLEKDGPVYWQLFKHTTPGKSVAVWFGPDLKEIWRAELPVEDEGAPPPATASASAPAASAMPAPPPTRAPLDPLTKSEDPDQDGFTNEDEWNGQTDPRDAESHPAYETKLLWKTWVKQPFRLKFGAYDGDPQRAKPEDMSFQVSLLDAGGRSQFLKIGDLIPNTKFKLIRFQFREKTNPATGDLEDVSELTLEDPEMNLSAILVLHKIADLPKEFAEFLYTWNAKPGEAGQRFVVAKGAEFVLRPRMDARYRLLEIAATEARIQNPKGEKVSIGPVPSQ